MTDHNPVNLMHGDCLQLMQSIDDKSIDLILCDLPYGTTQCKWDSVIDLPVMWQHLNRMIKKDGAIILFASQPFTSALISSNYKYFRYSLVWKKQKATGFLNAKKMPLRAHEDICVFYKKLPVYNAQMTQGEPYDKGFRRSNKDGSQAAVYGNFEGAKVINESGDRYPQSILEFKTEHGLHPTQKPVPLLEYLIRTYTNFDNKVLDICMGSGSTGVACVNTGRKFIGIEKDAEYFEIAVNRIAAAQQKLDQNLLGAAS